MPVTFSADEKPRLFFPFRLVLDFWDEDLEDHAKVVSEGQLLHSRLTSYFQDKLQRPVNVVFKDSFPSSLDHRSYIEIELDKLDILDGVSETYAELLAMKFIASTILEFVDDKLKDRVKEYLIQVGLARRAHDVDELLKDAFPTGQMIESTSGSYPRKGSSNGSAVDQRLNLKLTTLGSTIAAVLLVAWLCINLYQQYSLNKRIEIIADQVQITADSDAKITPLELVIRIENSVGSTKDISNPKTDELDVSIERDNSPRIIRITPKQLE